MMPMSAMLIDTGALAAFVLAAELPSSSGFQRWVLEQPEPLALALVAAGVAGFVALNRRSARGMGALLLGLGVTLAAGLWLVGFLIQTDRERLAEVTARLIRAVPASDAKGVDALLAPEVVVASSGQVVTRRFGRREILGAVAGFAWFKIDEWYQRPDGAALDGPNSARTRAVVRVRSSYYDSTLIPMTWEFTWRRVAPPTRDDAGWRLARMEMLTMWGREPTARWPDLALRAAGWAGSDRPGDQSEQAPDGFTRSRY